MTTCPCRPEGRANWWISVSKRDAIGAAVRFVQKPRRRRVVLAIGLVLGLLVFCELFVCESVLIPSSSMEPVILPNERVLMTKLPFRSVRRFDVVVIDSRRLKERIAKRVIGLPGERVRLDQDWKVVIDGRELYYQPGPDAGEMFEAGVHPIRVNARSQKPAEPGSIAREVQLGRDEYFVLGDNRLASRDSRVIGPIRRREIEGKLGIVWSSFDLRSRHRRWDRIFHVIR